MNVATDIVIDPKAGELRDLTQKAIVVAQKVPRAITDEATQLRANEVLVELAAARKAVEAFRKFIVGPVKEHLKKLDAWFAGVDAPLEQEVNRIKGALLAYRQEQVRAQAAAEREAAAKRRADEEARAKARADGAKAQATMATAFDEATFLAAEAESERAAALVTAPPPLAVVPPLPPARVAAAGGAVQVRTSWRFEVVDDGLVPRPYLKVDEAAIRTAVQAGVRAIPGVRIFEAEDLAVTASTRRRR